VDFDPKRLYLSDIDGSGTNDIVYAHHDRLMDVDSPLNTLLRTFIGQEHAFYQNDQGESISAPTTLPALMHHIETVAPD